jgi:ATP-dependent DNA helicase PIF1
MNTYELSEEQIIAFNKYIQGENIFITGPGGTGKSLLIKHIKKHADMYNKKIQVCAMTGCAALLLSCKAKTLHSWSGIGLGNGTIEQHVNKIMNSTFKKSIWKVIDTLIIDEVSMMSKKIMEMLDTIGKKIRKNNKPFGGIQLIFSGDFYQLPPVGNKDEPDTMKFCFESEFWNETFKKENHIELKKIFRQKDEEYCKILNEIREGRIKRSSLNKLMEQVSKNEEDKKSAEIIPTKLFPVRTKVDVINNEEIEYLKGQEYVFESKFNLEVPLSETEKKINKSKFTSEQIKAELEYIQSNLLCEKILKLKVGAQVMSIANIEYPNGIICNGSQGIIKEFNEKGLPVVKFYSGFEITMNSHIWPSENIPGIGVSQIPLILSWAITIHKSQGASLDKAEIDAGSSIFECGQTYVALSRVKSLSGLYLTSFDVNKIRINKKVREFYENMRNL